MKGFAIDYHLPVDAQHPLKVVPVDIVPSTVVPGLYLMVHEDGSSVVVEPDGSQTRTVPAGQPNWDSPWTQAGLYGGDLVYRSAGGTPRAYKVIL